jgi:transposase
MGNLEMESKKLRSLLFEAGIVVLTRSKKRSKLKAWGLKIISKKALKKAGVGAGRKLALIMHTMILEGKDFI